jgi:tryptophan-rich sensory protein
MILSFIIVGIILGLSIYATSSLTNFSSENSWYANLKQVPFQPPPITFSIVWPILYLILWYTISVSYPKDITILYWFILLAFLLALWSFVIFQLQSLYGSSFVLLITFIVSWIIWSKLVKVSSTQTVPTLFLLFIAWIFLATTLNTTLAVINS